MSFTHALRLNRCLAVIALVVAGELTGSTGLAVSIDFDNLPGMPNVIGPVPFASRLTNQLQPTTGAVFTSVGGYASVINAYNPDFGPNHTLSDPNMIAGSREGGDLSYRSRVAISFFDPDYPDVPAVTDSVSIRGDRIPYVGASALLEAYDVYGNFLNSSFMADSAAGLTLAVNSPGIHKVRISQVAPGAAGEDGGIGLDNLAFNTVVPSYRDGFNHVLVSDANGPPDGNGNFNTFFGLRLNDLGQVAFTATLAGTSGGANDDVGIYRADENFVVEIDREFLGGLGSRKTIGFAAGVALNNSGDVLYNATVDMPAALIPIVGREQVLLGDGGPRTVLAYEDQPAPEGNGDFGSFVDWSAATDPTIHVLNNAGQAVFDATLNNTALGGQDDQGIYRYSEGTLTNIDREFTGPVVHYTPHGPIDMNANGVMAYISTRGFNTPDGDIQISRANGVTIQSIAQNGDSVPGGFGLFADFGQPKINVADQVAFKATIDDGNLNDNGVFRSNNDGPPLSQIARAGQVSPDGVSQFVEFGEVAVNDFGRVALEATWAAGTKGGILVGNGGGAPLAVVQSGQAVPDGAGQFSPDMSIVDINNTGDVLFFATLTGPGVTAANDFGYFLANEDYIVQIARKGGLWSPDMVIGNVRSGDLNDVGQVGFLATLNERFGVGTQNVVGLYTPPVLPGDFNEDGIVSAADYVVWRNNLGFSGFDFPGDHDNSGAIDMGDYAIWRHHFGQSLLNGSGAGAVTVTSVPEPAAAVLACLATLASTCWRRRCPIGGRGGTADLEGCRQSA